MTTKSITIDELESLLNAIKQGQQLTVPDQPLDSPHEPPPAGGPPPPLAGGPPPPFGGPPPPETPSSGQSAPQQSQSPAVPVALTEDDKKQSDQALIQAIKALGIPANGTVESLTKQLLNLSTKVKKSEEEKSNYQETMGQKLSELLPSSPASESLVATLRSARSAIKQKKMQQQLIPTLQVLAFDASVITLDSVGDFLKHILINLFAAWRLKNEGELLQLSANQENNSDAVFMNVFSKDSSQKDYLEQILNSLNWLRLSPSYLKWKELQNDLKKVQSSQSQALPEENKSSPQSNVIDELKKRQQAQQPSSEEITPQTSALLPLALKEVIQSKDLVKAYFENRAYMSRYLFYPISFDTQLKNIADQLAQASGKLPTPQFTPALTSWEKNKSMFKDIVQEEISQMNTLKDVASFILTIVELSLGDRNRAEIDGQPLVLMPALNKQPRRWVRVAMPIDEFNKKIKQLDQLKAKPSSQIVNTFADNGFIDRSIVNVILKENLPIENTIQNMAIDLASNKPFTDKASLILGKLTLLMPSIKDSFYSIDRSPNKVRDVMNASFKSHLRPGEYSSDWGKQLILNIIRFTTEMPATYASVVYIIRYFAKQTSQGDANFELLRKNLIADLIQLNKSNSTSDETAKETGSQIGENKLKNNLLELIQFLTQGSIDQFYTELYKRIVTDSGLPDDKEGMSKLTKEFQDFEKTTKSALIRLALWQPVSHLTKFLVSLPQSLTEDQQITNLKFKPDMKPGEARALSQVYGASKAYFTEIRNVLEAIVAQQPFAWTTTEKQRVKESVTNIIQKINNNAEIEDRYKAPLQDYFTSIQTMTDQL